MFGPDSEIYRLNIKTVKFYPYRTAHVCPIFKIRESVIPDLRERLASFCEGQVDNHTVYLVNGDLAIGFSDGYIGIGGISDMREVKR